MAQFTGRVKIWSERRPNIESDLDDWYEELKTTHANFIQAKKVGYDDRTKLFHVAIADGFNEWILLSYNQNRIMLHFAKGTLFSYNSNLSSAEPIQQPSWALASLSSAEPIQQPSWALASQLQFMQNQMNNMCTQIQNMQAMLYGRPPTIFGSTVRPRSSTVQEEQEQ